MTDYKVVLGYRGGSPTAVAVAVPPPFKPSNRVLCGSCPLVTPY